MNHFIGLKLKRDIYTSSGSFLLAKNTLLRDDHINKLIFHNIIITEDDVTRRYIAKNNNTKLINNSLKKIKEIFQTSAYTKTIPFFEVKKELLPMITFVAENDSLFNVLNDLHRKDDYTYTHNLAVGILAATLGKWLKLKENDIHTLTLAAILHDIGKAKIDENILSKPAKLTVKEFEEVKNHTKLGYDIIRSSIGGSETIALVALQHHERLDGEGYPNGLKGKEIDFFSKVVAICDVFHAMTSNRVYKEAIPFHLVLKEMWQDSFGKLDPKIMTVFIKKIMETTIGSDIILSNGKGAKVIMLNPYDPLYPIVKDSDDNIIDLNTVREVYLEKIIN